MPARSICLSLTDASVVGSARRVAADLARRRGFDEATQGRVGVVVTEASSNALRHGEKALVVLRVLQECNHNVFEVLALDSGQGMADLGRCLEDGYSTAGTSGNGLGAIRRLADVFDVYSEVGRGTALLARFRDGSDLKPEAPRLEIGGVCLPKRGEEECGDGWGFQERPDSDLLMIADGLGHGPLAASAADEVIRVFEASRKEHPAEIIQAGQGPLRATRGASVAVVEISYPQRTLRYAGVGNICGHILANNVSRGLISHDGTLGHELSRVQEYSYPWPKGATLVMHSDGLMTRWDLRVYPGLVAHHPAIIAGVLYRDFERGRDDATILVARERA